MPDVPQTQKKTISPDWLVRGVLTKLGDTFDRLTGRGWKPSSSLATSELIGRLKGLLDAEVRRDKGGDYVPHNIKLKMQWDKFSTDSDDGLRKLETELLAAAVDHINDQRYYTYAPLSLEVKPDYFTPGVRILVSFEKFSGEEHEAGIDVDVPGGTAAIVGAETVVTEHPQANVFNAAFSLEGRERTVKLDFARGRRLSVGRTKENGLAINDASVSKIHASLTTDANGLLIVADTGSTNGTFIRGERISYGKTAVIGNEGEVRFGGIDVTFKRVDERVDAEPALQPEKTEARTPREFEMTSRMEKLSPATDAASKPMDGYIPAPTEPSITIVSPAADEKAEDDA